MSSISTRPRVQKINGPILTSLAVAGVVVAAKAIKAVLGAAGENVQRARRASAVEPGLQPVINLKEQFVQSRREIFDQAQATLPEIEAMRVATLGSIATTPFYVDNPAALQQHCGILRGATTLAQVKTAEQNILASLTAAHQQVFVNTLALACQRAAHRLGFAQVEVIRLPDEVRVVAADPAGRTLVSEIRADAEQEPALATEVVGVLDGSCQRLLDEFDRCLEEEGVRSAPPRRKFTGGVCELAAARDIAAERWKALAKPATGPVRSRRQDATRRAQRLNNSPTITVRPKG